MQPAATVQQTVSDNANSAYLLTTTGEFSSIFEKEPVSTSFTMWISIREPVRVTKGADGKEELRYTSSAMETGKIYPVVWNGLPYGLMKTESDVQVMRFYPITHEQHHGARYRGRRAEMMHVNPTEAMTDSIRKMGYVTVEPKSSLQPSFYRLKDGTLIQALICVNYLIPDHAAPDGYVASTLTTTVSYVPAENRTPDRHVPFDPSSLTSNILDDDMKPEALTENFNTYSMSNGMTLSVKSAVGQVGKTKFYTVHGEPLYVVSATPVFKITAGS